MKAVETSSRSVVQRALDDPMVLSHPFFVDLDGKHVEDIVSHSEVIHFEAGEFLFHEGEPADRLFLLLNGSVAIQARVNGGHLVRVCIANGQDAVGWSWLFPPFAWHFQAQALEPTTAIVCNGGHLLVMCEDDPVFGYEFMKRIVKLVIERLQATRRQLVNIEKILNLPAPS